MLRFLDCIGSLFGPYHLKHRRIFEKDCILLSIFFHVVISIYFVTKSFVNVNIVSKLPDFMQKFGTPMKLIVSKLFQLQFSSFSLILNDKCFCKHFICMFAYFTVEKFIICHFV